MRHLDACIVYQPQLLISSVDHFIAALSSQVQHLINCPDPVQNRESFFFLALTLHPHPKAFPFLLSRISLLIKAHGRPTPD